jgi:hypothetical protein
MTFMGIFPTLRSVTYADASSWLSGRSCSLKIFDDYIPRLRIKCIANVLLVSTYLNLGPTKRKAGGVHTTKDRNWHFIRTVEAPAPVYIAICRVGTSHVPTHGQVSAPSSLRWCDGLRRSGMAFKRNLRAIIFKSRPLPPPPPHTHYSDDSWWSSTCHLLLFTKRC